jgi:hypothetical protein
MKTTRYFTIPSKSKANFGDSELRNASCLPGSFHTTANRAMARPQSSNKMINDKTYTNCFFVIQQGLFTKECQTRPGPDLQMSPGSKKLTMTDLKGIESRKNNGQRAPNCIKINFDLKLSVSVASASD